MRDHEEQFGYRRAAKRIICSLKGIFVSIDNIKHQIKCEDITSRGARVFAPVRFDIDSYVRFNINARKVGDLPLEGKVCWCRRRSNGWQAGIRFNRDLTVNLKDII